jgi:hypothetical protein
MLPHTIVDSRARPIGPLVLTATLVAAFLAAGPAAGIEVVADFEGASAVVESVDQATRTIRCAPGGDPARGWPCWWWFRVEGCTPGEPLTVTMRRSTAVGTATAAGTTAGGRTTAALDASWVLPARAAWSNDGVTWLQTDEGTRGKRPDGEVEANYVIRPAGTAVHVAWGPPFTPTQAREWVRDAAGRGQGCTADVLCRSRGGREVPLLRVAAGSLPAERRPAVWVQARQHAWESGSSWVARGFGDWLLGDTDGARRLRERAEIFIVPVVDVDNAATGNGGKDAVPHDHNRDWSEAPHWNETVAAQARVRRLVEEGRCELFIDLHNPAPGDPSFFYLLAPDLLPPGMAARRQEFIDLAYGRISRVKPLIPMSNRPKYTGPDYHPRWREISANWASFNGNPHTVAVCLETGWNNPRGTVDGYTTVGAELAAAVAEHVLAGR